MIHKKYLVKRRLMGLKFSEIEKGLEYKTVDPSIYFQIRLNTEVFFDQ